MNKNSKNLQNVIRNRSLKEGSNKTGIPFITAYHFISEKVQMPQIENPYLYIVL